MANKKYKLPKYNNGGNFFTKAGELGINASLSYADILGNAVGMDNLVKDDHYKGYGAEAARGTSDVVGGIAKAALPIAANILAPGSGAAVGAAQQGLGMLNPQDPIKYDEYGVPIQPKKRTTQKIGNVAGQITSAAAPAIASAAASNSSSSSSGSGSARNGGIMRYGNGGSTERATQKKFIDDYYSELMQNWIASRANLSGKRMGPDVQTPGMKLINNFRFDSRTSDLSDKDYMKISKQLMDGVQQVRKIGDAHRFEDYSDIPEQKYANGGNVSNITQVNGPSHENGGVNIQTPTGEYEVEKQEVIKRESAQDRILSDKLRFPGSRKTIAQDFKPVEALNKIVNNMKLPKEVRASAESKLKSEFDNFYNAQEALKQSKVINYAKRMGVTLPSMLNGQTDPQGQMARNGGIMQFGNGGTKPPTKFDSTPYQSQLTQPWKGAEGEGMATMNDFGKNNLPQNIHNDMTSLGGKLISGSPGSRDAVYVKNGRVVMAHPSGNFMDVGVYNAPTETTTQNVVPATPYTLKNNPDVEARTQIRSTNNTPNPIDPPPRKSIEFGNIGAYNPNTGVMTKSTGYNEPIESQIINAGENTINRNGGVFKYTKGGTHKSKPSTDTPDYLPQQNWGLGRSMMNDEREPVFKTYTDIDPLVGTEIQGNPYDPTRALINDSTPYKKDPNSKDYSPYMQIGSQILQGVGQNVGNLYDLKRSKETEVEKYDRLTANLLNADATKANNKRLYKNNLDALKGAVSGNPSAYIQSRIGMAINRMQQDELAQQAVDNANASILNTTGAANQQISTNEKIANAQNRAMGRNLKSNAYSKIGQNIMGQTLDANATKMDSKTLDAIIASNPKWANSAEGKAYIKQFKNNIS